METAAAILTKTLSVLIIGWGGWNWWRLLRGFPRPSVILTDNAEKAIRLFIAAMFIVIVNHAYLLCQLNDLSWIVKISALLLCGVLHYAVAIFQPPNRHESH